jgi:4-amino-4-deoxychorismate lyase
VILVNGSPGSRLEAADRGLHYGDGLFETMAIVDGTIPLWDRHLQRFHEGCRRLGLVPPETRILQREANTLAAGVCRGVIKLILTRGVGGQAYRPPAAASPTRILLRRPWPEYPSGHWQHGVRVRICRTRLAVGGGLAGIKHLNRLEQVLARAEWQDDDIAEGLMLDTEGYVVEGTASNLFILEGDRLLTPPLDRCGVAGVMRAEVIARAHHAGWEATQLRLRLPRVLNADALFLTNAIIGVWPVREIAGQQFPLVPALRALQRHLDRAIGERAR